MEATANQYISDDEAGKVHLGRHQAQCSICKHPDREEIEYEWVNWGQTCNIAERYGVSRYGLYRHAHALGLFSKREKNIKGFLERMIEDINFAEMTSAAGLGYIKLYLSLIKPPDESPQVKGLNPRELFDKMSEDERKAFATDGSLPAWYAAAKGATPPHSQEGPQETQVTENTKLQ